MFALLLVEVEYFSYVESRTLVACLLAHALSARTNALVGCQTYGHTALVLLQVSPQVQHNVT